ncbi:copper homeostasis periplasmic binding protein CopC [Martelella alba]|uniref:Copper homeostasis periplasmic binding protein CopC n=1 Tax=Martelella alba TaxID=2590451 RepID=A0ABY2SIK2_9HYPH|nr:copper homeostasis periplasmic binding protein CopC [Martelella alba]TKI04682.1 copper homeostasis periplasmic binding protein CopC [Martelella alba]
MTSRLKPLMQAAVFIAGGTLCQQALAHAHLVSSSPADKASVAVSPDTLTLSFTEGLESAFSGVKITDAQGNAVPISQSATEGADKKTLDVSLAAPLKPGHYQVDWHALSVDGHKTHGSYGFTVE